MGETASSTLLGMFALPSGMSASAVCFLARDRLGIKPLYCNRSARSLRFQQPGTAGGAGCRYRD